MRSMQAKVGEAVYVIEDIDVVCKQVHTPYPSRCYLGEGADPYCWGEVFATRREALEELLARCREAVAAIEAELWADEGQP